jgi:hypothetical protein
VNNGSALSIDEIWYAKDEAPWLWALSRYWELVRPELLQLEKDMDRLTPLDIVPMGPEGWYRFLHDRYFVWKYTAKNRLATTRAALRRSVDRNGLQPLVEIKNALLALDTRDIEAGLTTAQRIPGLGIAGASGLLALLYPHAFGTVDQFVVKSLGLLPELADSVSKINPESLRLRDGVVLVVILRRKAVENNARFASTSWTPRKVDQALWAYRQ